MSNRRVCCSDPATVLDIPHCVGCPNIEEKLPMKTPGEILEKTPRANVGQNFRFTEAERRFANSAINIALYGCNKHGSRTCKTC